MVLKTRRKYIRRERKTRRKYIRRKRKTLGKYVLRKRGGNGKVSPSVESKPAPLENYTFHQLVQNLNQAQKAYYENQTDETKSAYDSILKTIYELAESNEHYLEAAKIREKIKVQDIISNKPLEINDIIVVEIMKIFPLGTRNKSFYLIYVDPLNIYTLSGVKILGYDSWTIVIDFTADGFLPIGNYLFRLAYEDDNDYFYQCGDDIMFQNIDWLPECIEQLKKQNDIGICGPINPPNYRILTQTLVSKKHWEIFGCYFPPQIKNWWCDDWINYVYSPHYNTKIKHLIAENNGGEPRYLRPNIIDNNAFRNLCLQLTIQGKRRITDYQAHS